jgi:hypothetical protein
MFTLKKLHLHSALRILLGVVAAVSGIGLPQLSANSFQPFHAEADPPCDASTTFPLTEYDALGIFYTQLGGSGWADRSNWGNTAVPADDWHGVTCAGGHITKLEFAGNNLNGTLPGDALAALPYLEEFFLVQEKNVVGSIPSQLGTLTHLRRLGLMEDGLTGEIPGELKDLSALESLNIGENHLSSDIPTWLDSLSQLKSLFIWNNPLSGPFPDTICNLSQLQEIYMGGLEVASRTIPSCLNNLHSLEHLTLYRMSLTGAVPDIFGGLPNLTTLNLSYNYLEGGIPESITQLNLVKDDPATNGLFNTDLSFNMLTASMAVTNYLFPINPNWQITQTVPPGDLQAVSETPNSIHLTWTPIPHMNDSGYYQVYYASHPGGPWVFYDRTVNKNQPGMEIENLLSDVTYSFKIKTFTPVIDRAGPWTSSDSTIVSEKTLLGGLQVTVTPTDTVATTLVYSDGLGSTTTITIPVGTVTQTVSLSYLPITLEVGFNFTKQAFSLTAFQDGMPVHGFSFVTPITMRMGYNQQDLGDIPEDKLVIMLELEKGIWRDASLTCSPPSIYERNLDENWVQVNVSHLTRFVLSDPRPYRVRLPILLKP